MREALRDAGRLEHILMSIGLIEEFTRDMTYEQFVVDKQPTQSYLGHSWRKCAMC